MAPIFSIIIPVYDVEAYLRDCLDSVLRQTFKEWECVCVDDGSRDGSGAILDEYSRRDSRFFAIRQGNSGVSAARNKALTVARGEWIVYLDADDILGSFYLEAAYTIIRESQCSIVFLGYESFSRNAPHFTESGCHKFTQINIEKSIPGVMNLRCLWGGVFRRDILPAEGFRPYCRGEDLLFVASALCNPKTNSVALSEGVFYGYRRREGSAMMSKITPQKLRDRLGYVLEIIDVLYNSRKSIDKRLYRMLGNNVTEGFVYDMMGIVPSERQPLLTRWYQFLERLKHYPVLTAWKRFVVGLCLSTRSQIMALLLCYIPHRLKKAGLHR